MNDIYSSIGQIRAGYKGQLIHYYNKGINRISEIAGVKITQKLINTIEKRYTQLGGKLPIPVEDILEKQGKEWSLI